MRKELFDIVTYPKKKEIGETEWHKKRVLGLHLTAAHFGSAEILNFGHFSNNSLHLPDPYLSR